MKTKDEHIKPYEFFPEGRPVIDSDVVEEIMDEYAEEYAKAFIKFAEYEHGIKGLNAAFDEFRKPK